MACGSLVCRFAFMGKSVLGRFSVSFQSAMGRVIGLDFVERTSFLF
jgi:hypothetical protein